MEIRKKLEQLADKKYQKFNSALLPNINNVLGVRVPVLRKLAKELFLSGEYKCLFENSEFNYMEEYMLKAFIIGLLNEPADKVLEKVSEFVPYIDNWAVCDGFCNSLKFVENNLDDVWSFLQPYFNSKREFELRFAYVMILNYYLKDYYINKVFELIDKFRDEQYYSKMAVAWLVSICYIKYPKETLIYLKKSKLDNWTFNKSIQKICESLKVSKETRILLKKLKR